MELINIKKQAMNNKISEPMLKVLRRMGNGEALYLNWSQGGWCFEGDCDYKVNNNVGDALFARKLIKEVVRCSTFRRYELTSEGKIAIFKL